MIEKVAISLKSLEDVQPENTQRLRRREGRVCGEEKKVTLSCLSLSLLLLLYVYVIILLL